MLLSLAGGAVGLILAVGGLRALMAFVPADLGVLRESGLNGKVLAFTTAVCVATGIICGLLPALRTLRANLAGVLKQGSKGMRGSGHHRTHNVLVISEIAMALVPLIGAGLLLRSFQHLLEVDPGFRVDHILTMEVEQAALPFTQAKQLSKEEWIQIGLKQSLQFEQIVERIRALPGVKEAAGVDDLPLSNEFRQASRFVIEGQPIPNAGARPIVQFRTVSLSYFLTMGIPFRKGRFFTEDDWKVPNAVINETMDGLLTDSISPRRFSAMLVGVFAVLAVALAAVGIYGVMSYTVSRRTQEIGVRMALGAQLASVRRMILGQTLKLTLIGVAFGLAGAFAVARFLTSLLFGVGTYDPVTFVGVAALLIAVALAASYIPARRAMRVDPMVALRYE